MKLLKPINQPFEASTYYIVQLAHRINAIETATGLIREAIKREPADDVLIAEMLPTMREWLVETLVQGAYIREYHIWEKDTKEYLNKQLEWNGQAAPAKWSGEFIGRLKSELARFSVQIPEHIIERIDRTRAKVNIAKHEPGLLDEHFVTHAEYDEATKAIDEFWAVLDAMETPTMLPIYSREPAKGDHNNG